MLHFYDGQIRRYLLQTIRAFSNFTVKYGDGTLVRVPVMYGDPDRQAASIIRQNSENKISSVPRIAVYITGLTLDRNRLSDSTFVGKVNVTERGWDTQSETYTQEKGKNYTIERLMPTPFTLKLKVDVWTANTDQKLQLLEQMLVLFNPSLELQTTDNYIDWTSLTVLELVDVTWSSRSIPVGVDTPIDLATLTFDTPVWISPPVKVKHLGVITKIITSIFEGADTTWAGVDSLGNDLGGGTPGMGNLLTRIKVTITDYGIQVYNGQAILLGKTENVLPQEPTLDIPEKQGVAVNWEELLLQYPEKLVSGSSKIYLIQSGGAEVAGTVAINPLDNTRLTVNWDPATYPSDTDIDGYNGYLSQRTSSHGTFDAIIDPTKIYPGHGITDLVAGDRFLIIEDIIDTSLNDVPNPWGTFTATANDIIEWDGFEWYVIFDSAQETDRIVYQTNIYKTTANFRVQFKWNTVSWVKSFEGEYKAGEWRLEL